MTPQELAAEFPLGADSKPQVGVPVGRLEKFVHASSRIFGGTVRDCWIYVPAQYDAATPACVLIVQDGADHLKAARRWHIPTVLDNLIHRGEIPVMIGIFIDPGVVPAATPGAAARVNRSFEYDSLGDRYARFLLEEILPYVGQRYNLRSDGGSRCVMGGSSGAFCAFNAAWERPDAFQRVVSIVGSYTALRGGHTLAPLVRLTEVKPLRVFLQSGRADLRVFAGDWWTANLEMLSALEYAGYEVNHIWADHAGHDEFHGSMIFPEALKWVWQGYPGPIAAGANSKQPVAKVLCPGEGWTRTETAASAGPLVAGISGEVFFLSSDRRQIHRIVNGRGEKYCEAAAEISAIAASADGRLFACERAGLRIVTLDAKGGRDVLHEGVDAAHFCVARNRNIYAADPAGCRVRLVTPSGQRVVMDITPVVPGALALSADESQLYVTDREGAMVWTFSIGPDGSLQNGAPFFPLKIGADGSKGNAQAIAVSVRGWSLFATRLGVQIADVNGLIAGIISRPGADVEGAAIGGPSRTELFVSSGGTIWRRPLRLAESLWC